MGAGAVILCFRRRAASPRQVIPRNQQRAPGGNAETKSAPPAEGCKSTDVKQQLKYDGEERGHLAKVFVRRNYLWLVSSVPGET